MELVEAGNNMTNENNIDVFDEGCCEEDRLEEDRQIKEPNMDLLYLDQNELDIIAELGNDLTSPEIFGTSHRLMRISPDLKNEISLISYESSPEQITTEDDGSIFINLKSIITSAQPTSTELAPSTSFETGPSPSTEIRPGTSTETPVIAVPKRKRRTKAHMAEFRV